MLPAECTRWQADLTNTLEPAAVALRAGRDGPATRGAVAVSACVQEYVHWTPGVELLATYRLTWRTPVARATSAFRVVSVTPDGCVERWFTADPGLPGVPAACDAEVMGGWLGARLHQPVELRAVDPVRYRPGRRCVLKYDVRSGDEDRVIYGKLLGGDAVEALAATLRAMDQSLIPRVVGVAPEWQLIVQSDAGGASLRSVGGPAQGTGQLIEVQAGAGLLARLHDGGGPRTPGRSLRDDADELQRFLPACDVLAPRVGAQLREGIDRVRSNVASPGPMVPSHGAFRLDQVHLSPAGPVLIDLDSYCCADRERDVGNLFAYLRWRGIRKPPMARALADVRACFLSTYERETLAPLDGVRLRTFEAVSLLKIAGRRFPRLKAHEWQLVPELISAAFEALDRPSGGR